MNASEQGPKKSREEEISDQARREIEEFIEQERIGVLTSKHLAQQGQHFDITQLTPEDLQMWHTIRHAPDTLTWEQYAEYRRVQMGNAGISPILPV